MKLDKISFAMVVNFINTLERPMDGIDINRLDDLIDIEIPEAQVLYPKNENVERLMMFMAGGTHKIDAIREHRAITGMGLKESKDAVERYWPQHKEKTAKELRAEMRQYLVDNDYSEADSAMLAGFIDRF